jgi:transcriptional regulator
MYIPPAFVMDTDRALGLLQERAFGTFVVSNDAGLPVAVHIPFLATRHGDDGFRVELHVARANPLHRLVGDGSRPALLSCLAADAYISPDWYGLPDQVPTWSYAAVHLSGVAFCLPASETRAHLDRLSAEFERRLAPKPPWTAGKMDPARLEAVMRAIVTIELLVPSTGIEAQAKLIQHKAATARQGAIAGLQARRDARSIEVAGLMQAALDTV